MTPSDPLLLADLRRDEGVRYEPYFDTVGIETVGVGHNLKASPLPSGWNYPLSDAQVDALLANDLAHVFSSLDANIGWWRTITLARQRCLANMCFNLGINGLLSFHNTLLAIEHGYYEQASSGMLASKWASQTGDRARRLADMMRVG